MKSVGEILDQNKGVGLGFDGMRLILALSVILWHSFPLTSGSASFAKSTVAWPIIYSIVPMFFALSGFLVSGSALRLTIGKFAMSRILRIVPALFVDTLFTVIILAPLFTGLPLQEFFTNHLTYAYLLNIVGEIHFTLPGVFTQNIYPDVVNGSLWTIPPELFCYVVMAGLIISGWIRDWKKVAAVFIAFTILYFVIHNISLTYPGKGRLQGPGTKLVGFFVMGTLFYVLRHRIPHSLGIFAFCVVTLAVSGFFISSTYWETPFWVIGTAPLYCYIIVYLGLVPIPLPALLKRGDYSYGIYLYAFPFQQAIMHLFPITNPVLLFLATVPPVMVMAMLSWHLVEKPTLRLRKAYSFAAKREEMAHSPK